MPGIVQSFGLCGRAPNATVDSQGFLFQPRSWQKWDGSGGFGEWIVMLDGYYDWERRQGIFAGLSAAAPFAVLPTALGLSDYALVQVTQGVPASHGRSCGQVWGAEGPGLVARMARLPSVRYVTEQRRVAGALRGWNDKGGRDLLGLFLPQQITTLLRAPALWELGFRGTRDLLERRQWPWVSVEATA